MNKIENILNETIKLHKESSHNDIIFKSNTILCNSILRACAKFGKEEKAHNMLSKMLYLHTSTSNKNKIKKYYYTIKPNLHAYHCVMASIINNNNNVEDNNNIIKGKKVNDILNRLHVLHNNKNVDNDNPAIKPNIITSNYIISAHATTKTNNNNNIEMIGIIKEENILKHMHYECEYNNNDSMRPNLNSCKYIMSACYNYRKGQVKWR